ncbi:DUF1566 domain-containing protein [bacterium]|nr:DUF1566 domain-containing protein [bacterium]
MFNHGNFVKQRPSSLRVVLALLLFLALGTGVVSCGSSSSDSRQRNATLVAGTKCKTAGQVKTISKQKVICATLPTGKFWYGIAKEKSTWVCIKLGGNRKQVGVFSVCGKNSKGKRRWFFTNVLMPAPKGLASTDPGAIEYVDKLNPTGDSIPLPDNPAALGIVETTTTLTGETTTTLTGETTTTVLGDTTVPAEVTTTTEFIAPEVKCTAKVGDTGPGGGVVFIDASTAGNITGECFEAAPATWALPWGCENQNVEPTTSPEIGKGKENTVAMLELCVREEVAPPINAASFADQLRAGGKDDWFLPSQDELKELYAQRNRFADCGTGKCAPDLAASIYWSSSHGGVSDAVAINFVAGSDPVNEPQKTIRFVRPVRSFK